jgi:hypothetical protein
MLGNGLIETSLNINLLVNRSLFLTHLPHRITVLHLLRALLTQISIPYAIHWLSTPFHTDKPMQKSPDDLRSLLAFNHASNSKNNDAILQYYSQDTNSVDIVTLEAIKSAIYSFTTANDLLICNYRNVYEHRIRAIQAAISARGQSSVVAPAPMDVDRQPISAHNVPVSSVTSTLRTLAEASTSSVRDQNTVNHFTPDTAAQKCQEDDDDAYWATMDDIWTSEAAPSAAAKVTTALSTSVATSSSRVDHTASQHYPALIRTLKEVFKLQTFRENQLEAMIATMSSLDVFVLMPTGGGKSLCFQVPAVCQSDKVTIVVCPLLSLMEDQVEALKGKGIDAALWNSETASDDAERIGKRLSSGNGGKKPCLVYVTPEKLKESHSFRGILKKLYDSRELARFVIDEAHCISSWGRDFREAVRAIVSSVSYN